MAWEPSYLTTEEFKNWTSSPIEDTVDDNAIAKALASASRAVDRYCSQHVPRQFGSTAVPEARYYSPRWDCASARWVIEIDDVDATFVSGMIVKVDTSNSDTYDQTVTSYIMRPKNAAKVNRVYTQISILSSSQVMPTYWPDSAEVTVRWGWASVPDVVWEATALQTNRYFKRRTAPFGVTGGPKNDTQVSVNDVDKLDEDIQTMLEDYVKLGWTL